MSKLGRTIGRLAIAAMFVESGLNVAREPGHRPKLAAGIGIPQPELAVRANGAGMAVGGVVLATGVADRYAAGLLAGLLIPTTIAGHRFWEKEDAADRTGQRIHFLKNLAMFGGLVYIASSD
jgi:putative oxidoreductase